MLSGFVVCLGNGGHFELEYSVNGKCGTSAKSAPGEALHAPEGESHCGTCTDVSLVMETRDSQRPTPNWDLPNSTVMVGSPYPGMAHAEWVDLGLTPQPPRLEFHHLAHLRTVRLLI